MSISRPLAVVTGASAGIGEAYARRLAAMSYDVVLVARRLERLHEIAAQITAKGGIKAECLQADLTREDGLMKVEECLAQAENLEFLLNNAGFGTQGLFHEVTRESQDRMHRLHVIATMRLTHAAIQRMTARGKGSIVNVSSLAAFAPYGGTVSYHATKAWMNAFTEALYLDLKRSRSAVKVQALCPGFTLTEFHDVARFDRSRIPSSMWMSAEAVVEASIRGLKRRKLIVIPGWRYKLIFALLSILPRPLIRAATS